MDSDVHQHQATIACSDTQAMQAGKPGRTSGRPCEVSTKYTVYVAGSQYIHLQDILRIIAMTASLTILNASLTLWDRLDSRGSSYDSNGPHRMMEQASAQDQQAIPPEAIRSLKGFMIRTYAQHGSGEFQERHD